MTLLTQQIARFLQSQRYWTIVEEDGVSVYYHEEEGSIYHFASITNDEDDEDPNLTQDCIRVHLESSEEDLKINKNDPQLLQKIDEALRSDLIECNVVNTLHEQFYRIPTNFNESRILHICYRPYGIPHDEFYFPITNTVAEFKRSLRDILKIVETWDDDAKIHELDGNLKILTKANPARQKELDV